VVRRQLDYQNTHQHSLTDLSCDADANARYYIGLGIGRSAFTGESTLRVRASALDNPDGWVPGFNQIWRGQLSKDQKTANKIWHNDSYLKGLRTSPFHQNERDLLAQYLAHNLSCILAQSGDTAMKVYVDKGNMKGHFADTIDMTGNYINRFKEVTLTNHEFEWDVSEVAELLEISEPLVYLAQKNAIKKLKTFQTKFEW
jgi:hypothetical protein